MALAFLDTMKRAFSSARSPGHALTLNGDLVVDFVQQSGPANYPTGGFVPDVAKFGLASVLAAVSDSAGGYEWTWDVVNSKIKVFASGAAEVANATNLSAITTTLIVIGRR